MRSLLRRALGGRANPLLKLALALRDPYRHPRQLHCGAERVLVLAPHMDDEAIGCGGAVLAHVAAGAQVRVVYMTDGCAGDARLYDPAVPRSAHAGIREALHRTRVQEATDWCAQAAVLPPTFLDGPDAGLSAAAAEVVPALRDVLRDCRPELIYLPSPQDTHPDHMATNSILCAALRGLAAPACKLRGYEVWNPLVANAVLDIGLHQQRKQDLLGLYASQLKDIDYRRLVGGLNTYRAVLLPGHRGHAEAFIELTIAQHRALLDDAGYATA